MTDTELAETNLSAQMRAYAQRHPGHDNLIELADKLDAACSVEPFSVPKVLGAWARARKAWCAATGEPLA